MLHSVNFVVQQCPSCGRKLEIRANYLGRLVLCSHCKKEFLASDQSFPAATATVASAVPPSNSLPDPAHMLLAAYETAELGKRSF